MVGLPKFTGYCKGIEKPGLEYGKKQSIQPSTEHKESIARSNAGQLLPGHCDNIT